jgi:proteic killer suppression protein
MWGVIEGFRHQGLRRLFEDDDASGVSAEHVRKLRLILSALDQAGSAQDLNQPTFGLHQLRGKRRGVWSVNVNANWRVTFRFEDGRAFDVNLEDYH